MKEYNFLEIEKKWQKYWEDNKTYFTDVYDFTKPKYYVLDMFPYPSGQGLHVGHPLGYTATDIIARYKRMKGYNVLHPMGFDAFGLPAEQYAIKTGNNPNLFTQENINNFRRQLKSLGFSYDWSKEISTCDPKYYKHTQSLFIKLYRNGLAKYSNTTVNWCEALNTVLANDEVIDGKSERGGHPVVQKEMKQWVIDVPKYADLLIDDLEKIDWPQSTKNIQRNWIGRSYGAIIKFKVFSQTNKIEVYTTRPDTIYGASYIAVAPEYEKINALITPDRLEEVQKYINIVKEKNLEERKNDKSKSGVFLGTYAVNPINSKKIPIYVADYVLSTYQTGIVMGVPAHDDRDFEFATLHNIKFFPVIEGYEGSRAYTSDGKHINSGFLDGLNIKDAIDKVCKYFEDSKIGKKVTTYKLREWVFSRQRYWGEPIPVIFLENKIQLVPEKELPLLLPEVTDYVSKEKFKGPLSNCKSFVNVEYKGQKGKREVNTMPGAAASSWYFMRYIDPNNDKHFADYRLLEHWLPVDLYVGGPEHAVGHLIYSRFVTKFLNKIGLCPVDEPFKKLVHQGLILDEKGEKMSKSKGNVINPDDTIKEYGADSLRLYLMFMGPLEQSLPWISKNVEASKKFLDRVFRLFTDPEYLNKLTKDNDTKLDYIYNYSVKKVTEDIENLRFNTAISQLMVLVNEFYKADKIYLEYAYGFIKMLFVICPHITEELWQSFGNTTTLSYQTWPRYDNSKLVLQECTMALSINGKVRDNIVVSNDITEEELKKIALDNDKIKKYIEGQEIKKIIVVKNKLVNIVI